jgi:hypothetical protein
MFRSPMPLDKSQWTMTLVVSGLCTLAMVALSITGSHASKAGLPVLFITLGLSWALSPCAVLVDSRELYVLRRAWWPLRVPLSSIASAAPLDGLGTRPDGGSAAAPPIPPGTIRLFGVGGFCGSYGLFHNAALGRFRMYATRRGTAVLVRRHGDALPIVLTPDDVAGTIDALSRRGAG